MLKFGGFRFAILSGIACFIKHLYDPANPLK